MFMARCKTAFAQAAALSTVPEELLQELQRSATALTADRLAKLVEWYQKAFELQPDASAPPEELAATVLPLSISLYTLLTCTRSRPARCSSNRLSRSPQNCHHHLAETAHSWQFQMRYAGNGRQQIDRRPSAPADF